MRDSTTSAAEVANMNRQLVCLALSTPFAWGCGQKAEPKPPYIIFLFVGVRTNHHRLIYYYELGEWELFDLEKGSPRTKKRLRGSGLRVDACGLKRELKRLKEFYRDDAVPSWQE